MRGEQAESQKAWFHFKGIKQWLSFKEKIGDQSDAATVERTPYDETVDHAVTHIKGTVLQTCEGEFVCGWGAALINIIITYPINKLQFRQQLLGIRMITAAQVMYREGFFFLYRGLLPPLFQKTTAQSLMFGTYDSYQRLIRCYTPNYPDKLTKPTAALLAGYTEALLCPLERIQTLMQDSTYHSFYKNTYRALAGLRAYGIKEYYRGVTPILVRNGFSNVLFFLLRGEVKDLLPSHHSRSGAIAADFVSGAVLGATISTLFYPVNVVKTRMQSTIGTPFISFKEAYLLIYNERNRSFWKIYRGVHVNFTRSLLAWGIINASYEYLKNTFFTDHS